MMTLLSSILLGAAVTAAGAVRDGWFEEMVPMGDGVRLYTYGAVPPKGTKCPVVIKRTPYSSERPINGADFARQQAEAIRRGVRAGAPRHRGIESVIDKILPLVLYYSA